MEPDVFMLAGEVGKRLAIFMLSANWSVLRAQAA